MQGAVSYELIIYGFSGPWVGQIGCSLHYLRTRITTTEFHVGAESVLRRRDAVNGGREATLPYRVRITIYC